jgi:hypothetical protein
MAIIRTWISDQIFRPTGGHGCPSCPRRAKRSFGAAESWRKRADLGRDDEARRAQIIIGPLGGFTATKLLLLIAPLLSWRVLRSISGSPRRQLRSRQSLIPLQGVGLSTHKRGRRPDPAIARRHRTRSTADGHSRAGQKVTGHERSPLFDSALTRP